MKKTLFTIALLLGLVCSSANAQWVVPTDPSTMDIPSVSSPVSLSLGVKGGVVASSLSGKANESDFADGIGVGYDLAALANLRFNKDDVKTPIALQVELMYKNFSAKTVTDDNLSLGYIEVPVMLQWYMFNNVKRMNGLYLEAGPSLGLNISSGPKEIVVDGRSHYKTGDLKANDVSLAIGIGYKATDNVVIGARYYKGTSDLAGNLPLKKNAFEVSLSYTFPLGK